MLFVAPRDDEAAATGQFDLESKALEQIHARIKHSFDPAGVFNPGRLSPHW
jgi:glycolate oxidase FAD binding subunit